MDEILRNLRPGARVLDLGSLTGSFPLDRCPGALVVRIDLTAPEPGTVEGFVQADAAKLPFPDRAFDAVIANHSLEHIDRLDAALSEVARVVRPEGSIYVAVPDASTFSDRLYRWLYHGGGHINPFCSSDELAAHLTKATGLELAGVRPLYSSFEYANRYYFLPRAPKRLWLVGRGSRRFIILLSYGARLFDRVFGTRASMYGWAIYCGNIGEEVQTEPWSNVCVGCGAGFAAPWLKVNNLVRRRLLFFKSYHCPCCGSLNLFTADPVK